MRWLGYYRENEKSWDTKMTDKSDFDLDQFFDAARSTPAPASDDFMARVMADAQNIADETNAPAPRPKRALWPVILGAIGGWAGFAGMATAAVTGVWIGISPPEILDTVTTSITGQALVDTSDFGLDFADDLLGEDL